jgi:hydroxymethylglutaryl-CoA reductase
MSLSSRFRRLDLEARRAAAAEEAGSGSDAFGSERSFIELADVMVESAVGYLPLPMGIVTGLLVDGLECAAPLATEEPSVIAAATYGASIVSRAGGFRTHTGKPITIGQIHVTDAASDAVERVTAAESRLRDVASVPLARMESRGGGLRGITASRLDTTGTVRVEFEVDVRDAMGANLVNTVAETMRPVIEEITGGTVLMAILSNASPARTTLSEFHLPVERLARAGRSGAEVADRIVLAAQIADADPHRAVTHNKGVMNGITALALATGNDTRALEAAAHSHAARDGRYRALTSYQVGDGALHGRIELPVVMGTVGGAAGVHPTARAALALLGRPDATRLAAVAASVGLAQNLAALWALVTEGIQTGHMGLHANRLAWIVGARGAERQAVVEALKQHGEFNEQAAQQILDDLRRQDEGNG